MTWCWNAMSDIVVSREQKAMMAASAAALAEYNAFFEEYREALYEACELWRKMDPPPLLAHLREYYGLNEVGDE